MVTDQGSSSERHSQSNRKEAGRIEDVLGEYVDRLNAGERVNPEEVFFDHPTWGQEIIEKLQAFATVCDSPEEQRKNEPLGILGDYKLLRQIGRGGMGIVYEAWQNSMDRRVALKVLPKVVAMDTRAVRRFILEAQAAGKLAHPNIVHVHGMGVEQQVPYYAMDFVEGETLAQILAKLKGARPDVETRFGKQDDVRYFANLAEAFAGVAEGLQHAHSHKIIHRDIKPSNLILDQEGYLRIMDFGLARWEGRESLTASGDFLGTLLYMSPEQARRKKIEVDHRTDIYSLGATLYEMLAGRPPFQGKDPQDTLSQIIERDPLEPRKINSRVPKDLETIVLKCLRKEPANRYGTAEALGQDLQRFVRGDAIEARPELRIEKLQRWFRRHWSTLTTAAVVLLLALIALWAIWRWGEDARFRLEANYRDSVLRSALKMEWADLGRNQRSGEGMSTAFGDADELAQTTGMEGVARAIDDLYASAALIPSRPDAYYHRARGLLILGRKEEGLRELEKLARLDARFVPAILLRSAHLVSQGKLDEANRLEEQARRSAEGSAAVEWVDAIIAQRRGRLREAAEAYGRFLDSPGSEFFIGAYSLARLQRGEVRLELKDPLGALEDFVVTRYLLPAAAEPVLLLGKTCCVLGRDGNAEQLFHSLFDGSAAPDDIALSVANTYAFLGKHAERLAWIDRVANSVLRETRRARALIDLGRRDEALEASRRAVELGPLDTGAATTHAWILYLLGRYEEGIRFTREAIARIPGKASLYHALAIDLYGSGRIEEAIDAEGRCLQLCPGVALAHTVMGCFLGSFGRLEEALGHLDKAQELNPRFAYPHYHRGWVYSCFGRDDEAFLEFGRAIELEPSWAWPRGAKGRLLLARGCAREALQEFEAAVRLIPLNPNDRACIGRMQEMLGDRRSAIFSYIEALGADSATVDAHKRMNVLLRDGGPDFPRDCLDRLLRTLEAPLGVASEPEQ